MKAEIISVGTEILLGEITDTNASYIASQLPLLGIDLYWVTQVGDNLGRIEECLERAWGRSDLILTTGGLGPTEDDLTREAIAAILGEELKVAASRCLRAISNRQRSSPQPRRSQTPEALPPAGGWSAKRSC